MTQEAIHKFVLVLVEHDEDDVFLFQHALARTGLDCDLRVCKSVTEAIDLLATVEPDVIVTDYQFDGYTAVPFVQWLRSTPRYLATHVIVWSGIASRLNVSLFEGLNVAAFRAKNAETTETRRWLGELRSLQV